MPSECPTSETSPPRTTNQAASQRGARRASRQKSSAQAPKTAANHGGSSQRDQAGKTAE